MQRTIPWVVAGAAVAASVFLPATPGHAVTTLLWRSATTADFNEGELDHVVVGHSSAEPKTDATQVDGFRWVDVSRLRRELSGDDDYAPWLSHALHAFPHLGLQPVSGPGTA